MIIVVVGLKQVVARNRTCREITSIKDIEVALHTDKDLQMQKCICIN